MNPYLLMQFFTNIKHSNASLGILRLILAPVCYMLDYCSSLDEFIAKLPAENSFVPMGAKLHSYKFRGTEYEVYQVRK